MNVSEQDMQKMQTPGGEAESPAAPEAETGQAAAAPSSPEDRIAALEREVAELRDRNLRLLADGRNMQQRALRDKEDALRYAESRFAKSLLIVLDDLERTVEAAGSASDAAAVSEGVRIIFEQFLKILKDHAIEPIEATGKPFDPSLHEALLNQPSAEHAAGMVVQEVARGYRMHDRVIRPARVIVSSGPPPASGDEPHGDSGSNEA